MADHLYDTLKSAADLSSKADAQYTNKGTKQAHCAMCTHYQHGYTCNKVAGRIFPGGWCKLFKARV